MCEENCCENKKEDRNRNVIYTIEDCHNKAIKNGGKCISNLPLNTKIKSSTKLLWECSFKHQWYADIKHVVSRSTWCGLCNKPQKFALEFIKEIGSNRNLILLSLEYKNLKSILKWKCNKCYFEFFLNFEKVHYRNQGCKKCSKRPKITLEDCQNLAKGRNGKLLSLIYINNSTNMEWMCNICKQIWLSRLSDVKRGSWCSNCKVNSAEKICKEIFESLLGYKFIKIRPKWLLSNKNKKLELDGYCEELNLAFEYNGRQHYEIVKDFHMTEDILRQQQQRDNLKLKLCNDNNVDLIVIKFKAHYTKIMFYNEIKNILKEKGYI